MKKKVIDSFTTLSELVLPNDTNMIDNLMGGRLLHLIDIVAGIAAQKHSDRLCVTASVDNVSFTRSIPLGSIVTLSAQVTRAFNTSMEIHVEVKAKNIPKRIEEYKANEAFITFVAVDDAGMPVKVPELIPETTKEKELYTSAMRRRELRLVLAGKIAIGDSTELKKLLQGNG